MIRTTENGHMHRADIQLYRGKDDRAPAIQVEHESIIQVEHESIYTGRT
jgi:hypothetical protein